MGGLSWRWGACSLGDEHEYGDGGRGRCSELEHSLACSLTSCLVRRRKVRARPIRRQHVEHIGRWTAAVVARELLAHSLIGDPRAWTHDWSCSDAVEPDGGWMALVVRQSDFAHIHQSESGSSSGWNLRRVGSGRAGCPPRLRGQEQSIWACRRETENELVAGGTKKLECVCWRHNEKHVLARDDVVSRRHLHRPLAPGARHRSARFCPYSA